MHNQLIERPLILAICGKSAAGKDTLAKWLTNYFSSYGLFVHNMISCTTRPPRTGEEDGIDYYFLTDNEFKKRMNRKRFIEYTRFRGWRYGVEYKEVKSGYINIGVFNIEGLKSLEKDKFKYYIIPIYLDEKLSIRLRRSRDREGRWRLEYFRRAAADALEFKDIKRVLSKFNGKFIYLGRVNGVWRQTQTIMNKFRRWGLLKEDKETKRMRLGNFV